MAADYISNPEAFAEANEKARGEYLRSLTLERAAEILENLLNLRGEFLAASEAMGVPPSPPKPLPGPTLAILLEGKPHPDG